jgi:hypothetical protein
MSTNSVLGSNCMSLILSFICACSCQISTSTLVSVFPKSLALQLIGSFISVPSHQDRASQLLESMVCFCYPRSQYHILGPSKFEFDLCCFVWGRCKSTCDEGIAGSQEGDGCDLAMDALGTCTRRGGLSLGWKVKERILQCGKEDALWKKQPVTNWHLRSNATDCSFVLCLFSSPPAPSCPLILAFLVDVACAVMIVLHIHQVCHWTRRYVLLLTLILAHKFYSQTATAIMDVANICILLQISPLKEVYKWMAYHV